MTQSRFEIWALAAWILLASITPALAGDVDTDTDASPGEFRTIQPADARNLFGKIAGLEGRWRGKSTKGWTDEVEIAVIAVIAGRSAVLFDSFDAHPNERMLTLFTLDGDALILTHYCVAGNQPKLQAEQMSLDGRRILFRFVEGGNMSPRDVGHMDSMRLTFESDGGFTEQWTWYQKGSEQWMEEIVHQPITDQYAERAKQ